MLSPSKREELEKLLYLEHQERGYEVLLIAPYYKDIIKYDFERESASTTIDTHLKSSPIILTYLDLYHFALRGQEQADFILERTELLRSLSEGK